MALSALLATSLAAQALPAPIEADVQCIAVFSLCAANGAEEQAGITGGIMFYIGRIEGRAPGVAIEGRLRELIADKAFRQNELPRQAQRCGNELVTKGEEVQRLGNALEGGQPDPGKRD